MDLKPVICPYCGREMELDDRSFEGHGFWYTCDCGASTPFCKSEEEANQCASKAAKPKWISTKDRLPEEPGGILICAFGSIVTFATLKENGVLVTKNFDVWNINDSCVTHWMPLPEPPKEDKGE